MTTRIKNAHVAGLLALAGLAGIICWILAGRSDSAASGTEKELPLLCGETGSGPDTAPAFFDLDPGTEAEVEELCSFGGRKKPDLQQASLEEIFRWIDQIPLERLLEELPAVEAWLGDHPRGDVWGYLILRWTLQDPGAAYGYIASSRHGLGVADAVLTAWHRTDPESLWSYLEKLPDTAQRKEAFSFMGARWVSDSPDEVLDWLRSEGRSGLKREAFPVLAVELGRSLDPETAWDQMKPLFEKYASTHTEALENFAAQAVINDPAGTTQWVLSLPEEQSLPVVQNVFECWFGRWPLDAVDWMEGLEVSARRDAVVQSYCRLIAASDIEVALSWAGQIQTESLRQQTLQEIKSGFR